MKLPDLSVMRVVIDTNLFVRALLAAPLPSALIHAWFNDLFVLIVSNETLDELAEVVAHPKFKTKITPKQASEIIRLLRLHAELIEISRNLNLCRDPKDNIFLSVAASAQADYLITADNDLLDDFELCLIMQAQFQVEIISIVNFLALLNKKM